MVKEGIEEINKLDYFFNLKLYALNGKNAKQLLKPKTWQTQYRKMSSFLTYYTENQRALLLV